MEIPPELRNELLSNIVGEPKSPDWDPRDVDAYFTCLRELYKPGFCNTFAPTYHEEFAKYKTESVKLLATLSKVAALLRSKPAMSIDDITDALIEQNILNEKCRTDHEKAAKYMIFCIEGWLTLLYKPVAPAKVETDSLCIDSKGFHTDNQPFSQTSRPLSEILSVFGVLCDLNPETNDCDDDQPRKEAAHIPATLQPSLLEASILTTIGNLEICWVDALSLHLTFEPSGKLYLFRFPSFTRMQSGGNSILRVILRSMRDDDNEETGILCDGLYDEIKSSYNLIFACRSKARKLYHGKERRKATISTKHVDAVLDEACGYGTRKWRLLAWEPRLRAIDASISFPILSARLLRLQRYIATRQARGLRALYHDDRNSYSWYTFWAVLWIGGIGLVLSLIQTILSALQVAYAIKSFQKSP